MAPNKIDQQFKSQLESRQLHPSNQAWERLSAQLDGHQKNRKRVFFQWLSVAALLIVALSVGGAFVFKKLQPADMPVIVDTPNHNLEPSKEIITNTPVESIEEVSSTTTFNEKNTTEHLSFEEKQRVTIKDETVQIAENNKTTIKLSQSFEDQKVNEVMATITEILNKHNEVTEQEIELLLKEAQRDILMNKIYNEQTKKVNASALLAQVEGELNQSFRDKVFEALKASFITVKTAVADRKN